ncbi:MAG TPA: hypothetical protein VEA16_16160 [Vicinamibacterales bacterium]|nr:hypothetical protein [Vicinamibacterales bacterium]
MIGDPVRLPEYSAGLERVEAKRDSTGACTEYLCYFKPRAAGMESIVDRNVMRWYEANVGYASSADANNAFGVTNDLNLVLVQDSGALTMVTWEEYYDAQDVPMMRAEYDGAFADIAERLIKRFGGRVIARTTDGPLAPVD